MEYLSREQIMNNLQQSFQEIMDQYDVDDIGIFEEEGKGDHYYLGYTVNKDGKTYHIHSPYMKNNSGQLAPAQQEWTIETDEPNKKDLKGFHDLGSAFREI